MLKQIIAIGGGGFGRNPSEGIIETPQKTIKTLQRNLDPEEKFFLSKNSFLS